MSNKDDRLEKEINKAKARLDNAYSREAKRQAWRQLKFLIGCRTKRRIREMEKAKGLR
jgi:hypothetical protein